LTRRGFYETISVAIFGGIFGGIFGRSIKKIENMNRFWGKQFVILKMPFQIPAKKSGRKYTAETGP
jgi:hypothetical protein